MTPSATAAIGRCIDRCSACQDGRGAWRAERACAAELSRDGDAYLAAMCAAAARRLGEWLRGAHQRDAGGVPICAIRRRYS